MDSEVVAFEEMDFVRVDEDIKKINKENVEHRYSSINSKLVILVDEGMEVDISVARDSEAWKNKHRLFYILLIENIKKKILVDVWKIFKDEDVNNENVGEDFNGTGSVVTDRIRSSSIVVSRIDKEKNPEIIKENQVGTGMVVLDNTDPEVETYVDVV